MPKLVFFAGTRPTREAIVVLLRRESQEHKFEFCSSLGEADLAFIELDLGLARFSTIEKAVELSVPALVFVDRKDNSKLVAKLRVKFMDISELICPNEFRSILHKLIKRGEEWALTA
ncbi:MAG: hypothetical protein NTZ87_01610 [Candidatus Nomurabacteria bacterium]|nr:hypothetical protein [Candidatus Nomurabacteria bacterium]